MTNLPAEARQILARLELISHGKTQSFNPNGRSRSSKNPGGERPPGESRPPHIYWRDRMLQAPDEIPELIRAATRELNSIRQRTTPTRVGDSDTHITECILVQGTGWAATDVAIACRTTVSRVRTVRQANGRDPINGTHLRHMDHADAKTARQLVGQGYKITHIATKLGVDRRTIQRWLGKAA